jgi:hypothetical protein
LVSRFMRNNVRWEGDYDNRVCGGNQYDPAWVVYQNGVGDCDDHATLQCYFLERNGWDAWHEAMSIEGPPPKLGHSVCAYKAGDGSIYVLNNSGQTLGPFRSYEEVGDYFGSTGWAAPNPSIRLLRASQITQPTTDSTTPSVLGLPWSILRQ